VAKFACVAGTTSKLLRVFIQNSSLTTGAGLTGLAYNTSGLTAYYIKEGDSSTTSISLVTATLGTFTSGGFIVVDATNMPGVYELGIPNAALASGKSVLVFLQGAANMAPTILEIEVTQTNNQAATVDPWSVALPGSYTSGEAGNILGNTSSTDPWSVTLPGAYSSGKAGYIVGTSLPGIAPAAAGGLVTCDATNSVKIQTPLKKNTGFNLAFVMRNTSGTAQTGLTVTAQVVLANGSFVSCTNAVSEIAYGWYYIVLAAADVHNQSVGLRFSASGAQDTDIFLPMLP
jgi:hypothetical protein